MTIDIDAARAYISGIDLPEPFVIAQDLDGEDLEHPFDAVKDQASVVGQDVIAFTSGTEVELRKAISSSSLLAQMVADRRVPDKKKIYDWYDAYFEVLRNVGWVVQDQGWAQYEEGGDGFEVHEKIAEVAAVLLGAAPAALAIVTSTLNALKGMNADSPFITLFNRETVHAEAARFQISVIEGADAENVLVSMIAFGIKAQRAITQVLFFKVKKNRAELRSNSSKVSINVDALRDLGPLIRDKVRGHQRDYIKNLPDLH
jgi:hypothetical protein